MWEFGEFAVDRYLVKDMQKDRIVNRISSVKINENNYKSYLNACQDTVIRVMSRHTLRSVGFFYKKSKNIQNVPKYIFLKIFVFNCPFSLKMN